MVGCTNVPATANREPRSPNLILAALLLASVCYSLLQSLVVPALPALQREFGASRTGVAWIFTVLLLVSCVVTPVAGRLGDMFGKRRVLIVVMVVLALGTLLSAIATTLAVMIAGRAIQGAGGAIFPLAFGVIREQLPARRVPTGIAFVSSILGLGGAVGIVLAGPVLEHLSYHWLFWFPFLIAVAATLLVVTVVPESPERALGSVNWPAAIFFSGSLTCFLLAISQAPSWGWVSERTIALVGVAGVLAGGWLRRERDAVYPLVDLKLLRLRGVWTANAAVFLFGWSTYAGWVLLPQFVEAPVDGGYGFGASVTAAGLFMLPWTFGVFVASALGGRLSATFGAKWPLAAGSLTAMAGFGLLVVANDRSWTVYVASGVIGVGIGLAFSSSTNLVVESVPLTDTSVATGTNVIVRIAGGVIGTQVAVSIVASHTNSASQPHEHGYLIAFLVSVLLLVPAAVIALHAPSHPSSRRRVSPRPATATAGEP
jgi:MFS family permease